MRFLFWFLLLAVAAVVAALAARLNAGYALLVAPPYRVELSLNLLLILIVGGFAALYFGLRVIVRTVQLPAQVREWRRLQKKDRARAKLDAAIVALLEGRYGKAQQQAQEALALPHSSGLAALVAARAAIDVRQFDAAEAYLGRPETQARSLAVPRLTLSAEIALEQGQPQEALRILESLKREAGMHTAALRLELRASQAARRFAPISPLVEQLVKRGVFDAAHGEQVWLAAHNQDAALLRVLGTLCQRQQLWGKAQTYLEASVALDDHWRTHLALGEMLGRLSRSDEANTHFVAALRLATDELKRR